MRRRHVVTAALSLSLTFGLAFWSLPGRAKNGQNTVNTNKNKKKKRHHGRPQMAQQTWLPHGVARTLPAKRAVSNTSAESRGNTSAGVAYEGGRDFDSAVVVPDPGAAGQSHFGTETILTQPQEASRFHAAVEGISDSINKEDFHVGNNKVWALSVRPRLIFDITNDSSAYVTDQFTNFAPSGVPEFSIINRPEIGYVKDLTQEKNFVVGAGFSMKLPFFDAGGSDLFAEPMRVWQFGVGMTGDYVIPDTTTHVIAAAKFAYDTKATFTKLTSDPETGAPVNWTGYQRPVTLLGTFGMTHDEGHFTVGLAFHTVNQLASASALTDGGVLRDVSPISLLRGEIFGAYHFVPNTYVNGSLSRGLRTSNDVLSYAPYDYTEEVAQTSLVLGLTQIF